MPFNDPSLNQLFSQGANPQGIGDDLLSGLSAQLSGLSGIPGPAPEEVPGQVSAFGTIGSTFAAALAEQLGARGASQQNFARLQQHQVRVERAEERNRQMENAFGLAKQRERLSLQEQISDVKMERFKQAGDLAAMEKEAGIQARLEKQKFENKQKIEGMKIKGRLDVEEARNRSRKEINQLRLTLNPKANAQQKELLRLIRDRFNKTVSLEIARIQTFQPGAGISPETLDQLRDEAAADMMEVMAGTFQPRPSGPAGGSAGPIGGPAAPSGNPLDNALFGAPPGQ